MIPSPIPEGGFYFLPMRKNSLLPILPALLVLASCSQYDTDVVGEGFRPLNGLVGPYTHIVYVEFHPNNVEVWGPHASEVEVEKKGAQLTLRCQRDSMAYFCFGNAYSTDEEQRDGHLYIQSAQSYALYLNGLRLSSQQGPALWSDCPETCHLVLTAKSINVLQDGAYEMMRDADGFEREDLPDACLMSRGALVLNGTGTLNVTNQAAAIVDDEMDTAHPTHAIHAMGGLRCGYEVKMNLTSELGDALHVDADDVTITNGTWSLNAGRHGIVSEGGGVLLAGGKMTGTALSRFVDTHEQMGLVVGPASCLALSGEASVIDEEAKSALAQSVETHQHIWQQRVDSLTIERDSIWSVSTINRKEVGKIVAGFPLSHPWVLVSHSNVVPTDTLRFEKVMKKK